MPGCCAYGCSNSTRKGFKLYAIPRSKRDPSRRQAWLDKISRENFSPTGCVGVCEVHFEKSQFERAIPNKLKPNAIPTLFCHLPVPEPQKSPERPPPDEEPWAPKKRICVEHAYFNKNEVDSDSNYSLHSEEPSTHNILEPEVKIEEDISSGNYLFGDADEAILPDDCSSNEESLDTEYILTVDNCIVSAVTERKNIPPDDATVTEKKIISLNNSTVSAVAEDKIISLDCVSGIEDDGAISPAVTKRDNVLLDSQPWTPSAAQQIESLKRQIKNLQHVVSKLKTEMQTLEKNYGKIFNPDQVRAMKLDSISGVKWSDDTIRKGVDLRFTCGSVGYALLRAQGYPLPAERTLRAKAASFKSSKSYFPDETNDDES